MNYQGIGVSTHTIRRPCCDDKLARSSYFIKQIQELHPFSPNLKIPIALHDKYIFLIQTPNSLQHR